MLICGLDVMVYIRKCKLTGRSMGRSRDKSQCLEGRSCRYMHVYEEMKAKI